MRWLVKTLCAALFVLSLSSVSADEEKNVSIFIKKTSDSDTTVDLTVDGTQSVFKLPALQDGETRAVTTESGATITLMRKGNDITVLTGSNDGEPIIIPAAPDKHLSARIISKNELENELNDDTIRVFAKDLSQDQIATIKAAIESAGITRPVKFVERAHVVVEIDDVDMDEDIHWETKDKKHVKKRVVVKKVEKN